jgi:ribosome biogenesis protein BRX1
MQPKQKGKKSNGTTNGLPIKKERKWKNRQRCLLLSSRGVSYLARHTMQNLEKLMPHIKTDSKFDNKSGLHEIAEIAEMKNCNKVMYIEMHRKQDAYLWICALPHGPSAKFHLENLHTMEELKMTGNCLKGSRPIISFTDDFDKQPYLQLLKELFTQTMGTPRYHPKSQPFIDHVFNFALCDNRIWFRNYQIVEENGTLAEVGPRFVLNLIKIFDGCFGGFTLYDNPSYIAPMTHRMIIKQKASIKYNSRISQKLSIETRRPQSDTYVVDDTDDVFKI